MAIHVSHIKPEFVDVRGGIARIVDQDIFSIRAVLRITSKKGTTRANHLHKTDYHYIFVEKGSCKYSELDPKIKKGKIQTVILEPGDLVLSKPGIIHGVKFLKDTVLLVFTSEKREQNHYEEDIKRIKII